MERELSLFVGVSAKNLSDHPKHLDVCDIHPAGFSWGTEERERVVIVKADISTEQQAQLLECETDFFPNPNYDSARGDVDADYKAEREFIKKATKYRKYTIDVTKLSGVFKTALDAVAADTDWNNRLFFSGDNLSDGKPLSCPNRLEIIEPVLK